MIAPSLSAGACLDHGQRQRYRVAPVDGNMVTAVSRANDVAAENRAALVSLLVEVADGNEDALKAVYDATSRKLFGVCLRICTNHECAAEALQDTYLVVWLRAQSFDHQRGSPITWLVAIARNKAIDMVRRRQGARQEHSNQFDQIPDERPNPEQSLLDDEAGNMVASMLGSLNVSDVVLIKAIYEEELSYTDLAARVGRPRATVKSRVRRAIIAMRTASLAETQT